MMKMTRLTRNVHCPFSVAVPLIARFNAGAPLRIGPFAFIEFEVDHALAETHDSTDRARAHEALLVQWRSHGLFPVPRFRGLITARPNAPTTEIRIDGEYTPPLGSIGKIFDILVGRYIARRTLERLLDRIVAFINGEYGVDRMPHGDR